MDIIEQFNLPRYLKGKSFAEASKSIAKRFEGRNSPEDLATLNDLQERLKNAQEFIKSEKEKRSQPEQSLSMPTSPNEGTEQYYKGGFKNKKDYFLGGLLEKIGGMGGVDGTKGAGANKIAGAVTSAANLAKTAFGKTGIDTSGATPAPSVPSKGASALSGAMQGAQAGMAFGPAGALIGTATGALSGLIGGSKRKNDADEAAANNDFAQHRSSTNMYREGGEFGDPPKDMDFYSNLIEDMNKVEDAKNLSIKDIGKTDYNRDTGRLNEIISESKTNQDASVYGVSDLGKSNFYGDYVMGDKNLDGYNDDEQAKFGNKVEEEEKENAKTKNTSKTNDEEGNFNPAELLRYSPAVMNLAQLANLKPSESIGLNKLGNTYKKQLVDEKGLQNVVQNSVDSNRNAILSSSGGSGSAARANLLASQLQGSKALSDAYMKSGAENRQEGRVAQNFDLGVDRANLNQSNQETNLNLEQKAAYETNKSRLLAQLGQDLGGVGKEELLKRFPELMGLNYNWRGKKKNAKKRSTKQ